MEFLRSPGALALGTLLTLAILTSQARSPAWASHLTTDVGVYAQRAATFAAERSWAGLRGNEYQPGALFFFLLPKALARFGIPYLQGILLLNALLLTLHIVCLFCVGRAPAAWMGLLFFLVAGPISFFRFELLVSLLVLLSFLAWRAARPFLGGVLLGWAAVIKIYPLVLLPVIARRPDERGHGRTVAPVIIGCSLGVASLLVAFALTGGTGGTFLESLRFHAEKPVSVQSTLAAVATAVGVIRGELPEPINTYGIHGLVLPPSAHQLATAGLLSSLGLLSIRALRMRGQGLSWPSSVLLAIGLLLSFLFWSTLFQPQYVLWVLAFAALLPTTDLSRSFVRTVAVLFLLLLATEQILYPLHYTAFLNIFYRQATVPALLTVYFLGKGVLVLLYGLILWGAMRKAST